MQISDLRCRSWMPDAALGHPSFLLSRRSTASVQLPTPQERAQHCRCARLPAAGRTHGPLPLTPWKKTTFHTALVMHKSMQGACSPPPPWASRPSLYYLPHACRNTHNPTPTLSLWNTRSTICRGAVTFLWITTKGNSPLRKVTPHCER